MRRRKPAEEVEEGGGRRQRRRLFFLRSDSAKRSRRGKAGEWENGAERFQRAAAPKPGARFRRDRVGLVPTSVWLDKHRPRAEQQSPDLSLMLFGLVFKGDGGRGCLFWQKCKKKTKPKKIRRRSIVSSTCAGDGHHPPLKLNCDTEKSPKYSSQGERRARFKSVIMIKLNNFG